MGMEARNLAELYDLPTLDWSAIVTRLADPITQAPGTGGPDRHTFWLTTLNADGSPHVNGIGALWVDGTFFFETGEKGASTLRLQPRNERYRPQVVPSDHVTGLYRAVYRYQRVDGD